MHLYQKRAILDGAEAEIFKLLSYGATPEQWADWLRAPLEHAVARGNLDLVNRLLEAGACGRAGWRGCRGRTLIDAATLGGNPDVVSALLRTGCRPDVNVVSVSSRRSALHVAVACGQDTVAKTLIMAGADVDLVDPHVGGGPLHIAARGGQEQLARDLLIGGASPNTVDEDECTPLHIAAFLGHDIIVSVLLVSNVTYKDAVRCDGKTSLIIACMEGHLSTVCTLLAAGADATLRDVDDTSALDLAASSGHASIMTALLKHEVGVHATGLDCFTALHHAAESGCAVAVDMLLDGGANVGAKTTSGKTPLHHVGNLQTTLALLRRGAKINEPDHRGATVLNGICTYDLWCGAAAVVDLLLRWGASETAVDGDGNTPADCLETNALRGSCMGHELGLVRALLARAPADRVWRRRCWVVMLRSRAEKERAARYGGDGSGEREKDDEKGCCGDERGGSKRIGRTYESAGGGAGDGKGVHTDGEEKAVDGEDWRSVVSALVGLELEGVFRKVVAFL